MLPLFVASWYFFNIMNLCLLLKFIPFEFKSLSSVWFGMRSICYLLCINMHIYRSGVIVNASNKELQACVW